MNRLYVVGATLNISLPGAFRSNIAQSRDTAGTRLCERYMSVGCFSLTALMYGVVAGPLWSCEQEAYVQRDAHSL